MFNSREYEWADITLMLSSQDMTGITAVKYKEKAEREPNFAKGRYARSIQTGNIAYEGEITLLQSDYLALRRAGGGSVLSLNVDATVSYGNPSQGDAMTTDRLEGIRFSDAEMAGKQGDKKMEVTLPFLFLKLVPDV